MLTFKAINLDKAATVLMVSVYAQTGLKKPHYSDNNVAININNYYMSLESACLFAQ